MNAAMRSPETYSLMSSVCPEKVSMSTGISHSTGSVSAKQSIVPNGTFDTAKCGSVIKCSTS